MGFMIVKPARTAEVNGTERTLSTYEQWYISGDDDFHCQHGTIRKADLKEGVQKIDNETFYIFAATFGDQYKTIRRKAQVITRKDLGFILGNCGLTRESIVVESGSGSGGATCFFASICKSVTSYERNKENIDVTRENVDKLELKNVTIHEADFSDAEHVNEENADLVLLDLPVPWLCWESIGKVSKAGAYIVAYLPCTTQVQQFEASIPDKYLMEKTCEVIQRNWKVKGEAVRPNSTAIGHTAFLVFVRRIGK